MISLRIDYREPMKIKQNNDKKHIFQQQKNT